MKENIAIVIFISNLLILALVGMYFLYELFIDLPIITSLGLIWWCLVVWSIYYFNQRQE